MTPEYVQIGADHCNQFVYRFSKWDGIQYVRRVEQWFTPNLCLVGTYCKPWSQWSVFDGDYCSL